MFLKINFKILQIDQALEMIYVARLNKAFIYFLESWTVRELWNGNYVFKILFFERITQKHNFTPRFIKRYLWSPSIGDNMISI